MRRRPAPVDRALEIASAGARTVTHCHALSGHFLLKKLAGNARGNGTVA
jgi:hypothetical protein